jgi:hypothetical protein
MVKKTICIGKSFERGGSKIVFASKKPRGALFRQRTANYTRYVRGNEIVFVAKKNVKLKRC